LEETFFQQKEHQWKKNDKFLHMKKENKRFDRQPTIEVRNKLNSQMLLPAIISTLYNNLYKKKGEIAPTCSKELSYKVMRHVFEKETTNSLNRTKANHSLQNHTNNHKKKHDSCSF